MQTDLNGCSTCPAGHEHYESFSIRGRQRVQYDYRTPDGQLFSTVAASAEEAREKRDAWIRDLGRTPPPRRCCECRAGEHENYDDNVRLHVVRDPETGRIVRRGYLCGEHVTAYLDDGYSVE